MTACINDCAIRGQHETDCEDRDACTGCLPRPAEYGLLCAWDWQRLSSDVATAPALVHHLREIGKPYTQNAPPSDSKSYRDPAESSILPPAWTAADEIHANLASWVLLILEEHPNGQQMAGPDEVGAWHTRYGTTVGIIDTAAATVALVDWLTRHLPWCAEQEWAGVMRKELGALIATTSARWPTMAMVEPEKHVPVPCPRCQRQSLTYAPPSFYRQPFKVSCANPDCARVFSEDEWDRFKALALAR